MGGGVAGSLTNVGGETQGDGLVRADQITGIDAHQTPALSGKPSRWLLDVILGTSIGSGTREGWVVTVVHRTLIQTPQDPGDAPAALARLLAQLALISDARGNTTDREPSTGTADTGSDELVAGASQVRFRFVPFSSPAPGHHTGAEYRWLPDGRAKRGTGSPPRNDCDPPRQRHVPVLVGGG